MLSSLSFSFRPNKQQHLLLLVVVLVLTSINSVNSLFLTGLCNRIIPSEVGSCSKCRAGWRPLRTGLFVNLECTLAKAEFGDTETVFFVPTLSGNYYQRNVASTTGVTLAVEGTYEGNPVPKNLNLQLSATHVEPLVITSPFEFTKCTAKVSGKTCVCNICGSDNSGFSFDCSEHNIIENPAIPFPDTSATCFDLGSLV